MGPLKIVKFNTIQERYTERNDERSAKIGSYKQVSSHPTARILCRQRIKDIFRRVVRGGKVPHGLGG